MARPRIYKHNLNEVVNLSNSKNKEDEKPILPILPIIPTDPIIIPPIVKKISKK